MRWLTIRLYRTSNGWVWADRAGWGPGVFKSWFRALWRAIK